MRAEHHALRGALRDSQAALRSGAPAICVPVAASVHLCERPPAPGFPPARCGPSASGACERPARGAAGSAPHDSAPAPAVLPASQAAVSLGVARPPLCLPAADTLAPPPGGLRLAACLSRARTRARKGKAANGRTGHDQGLPHHRRKGGELLVKRLGWAAAAGGGRGRDRARRLG